MDCRVEFDYDAQEDDELTIKKGETIRNVTQVEEGWMKGELNGKEGVFPDNFIKILEKSRIQENRSGVSDDKLINKRVRVLHPYTARLKDELSLTANTHVEIICEIEDGWLKAQQNGRVGVIPANFVDYNAQPKSVASNGSNNAPVSSASNANSNHINEEATADSNKNKKVGGIGFGNIFNGQKIQLKSGNVSGGPVVTNRNDYKKNEESLKSNKEYVRVKFPYKGENSDELDLEPGEIISIIDKNLEDEGWWKGEMPNKRVGVFPDNFVEPIATSLALELLAHRQTESNLHPDRKFVPPVPPHKPNSFPTASNTQPVQTKRNQLPLLSNPPISQTSPVVSQNSAITKLNGRGQDVLDLDGTDIPAPLTSLTADRPKQPTKRPPSKSPQSGPISNLDKSPPIVKYGNSEVGVASAGDGVSAVINEFRRREQEPNKIENERPSARKGVIIPRSNVKSIVERPVEPTNRSSRVLSSNVASGEDYVSLSTFNELQNEFIDFKRQFNNFKEATVSKSEYETLRTDYHTLRSEFDSLKSTIGSRLQDLMSEIDEEKKLRMADHVEMKRVRKLVMEIDNKKLLN